MLGTRSFYVPFPFILQKKDKGMTTSFHRSLLFFTALASVATGAASIARAQTVTDLGDLGGGGTDVAAMTPDGRFVIGRSGLPGGIDHGYRWEDGVMIDLGTFGGMDSYVSTITDDGSIVGGHALLPGNISAHAFLWENGILTDLGTLGGADSNVTALSADGSVAAGGSYTAISEYHAFRWESGVMTDLGTLGGTVSYARYISSDGSVIGGDSFMVGDLETHAYRWTGGVMTDLGTLGGTNSNLKFMSTDGSVLAGDSWTVGDVEKHAFRWTGGVMTDLGVLPGGSETYVLAMTPDGSVLAGSGNSASATLTGWQWKNGVMTDIGTLGGSYTYVYDISDDGNVIVGDSEVSGGASIFGFVWNNGVMTSLGSFSGVGNSLARVVTPDGQYVAGHADTVTDTHAFRWSQATGLQDLNVLLADAGGSLGNFDFLGTVTAISDDGNILLGEGSVAGNSVPFIFSMLGGNPALSTPEEIARGLTAIAAPSQQAQSAIAAHSGQSLMVARNAISSYLSAPKIRQRAYLIPSSPEQVEPAAGPSMYVPPHEYNYAAYAVGSFGVGQGDNNFDNTVISGNTGMLFKLADDLAVGLGVIGSRDEQETYLGGDARTSATGGTFMLSSEPEFGMRFYATGTIASLDISMDRHYRNGGSVDSSEGETDGMAYGAAARFGYAFETGESTSLMPYGEVEWSRVTLDGYTERGGAFAASVDDQKDNTVITRLGAELSFNAAEDLTLRTRAAWGHDHSNEGDGIEASINPLSLSVPNGAGDRNWAEGGVTALWESSERTTFSADLGGRTGETAAPALNLTVGVTYKF